MVYRAGLKRNIDAFEYSKTENRGCRESRCAFNIEMILLEARAVPLVDKKDAKNDAGQRDMATFLCGSLQADKVMSLIAGAGCGSSVYFLADFSFDHFPDGIRDCSGIVFAFPVKLFGFAMLHNTIRYS